LAVATIEDRLLAANFRPTGFDYMRIILAVSIVCFHSILTSYGPASESVAWDHVRPIFGLVLPMFFALSGFLVCGSLERTETLIKFIGLRALRLVPALAVEITLSALVVGPAFTNHALSGYFHDPLFSHYFLNIVGDIHYHLPGVFHGNPNPDRVNQQLWTIPWELKCYLVISAFAFFGLLRFRWLSFGLSAALPFLLIGWVSRHHGLTASTLADISGHKAVSGFVLVAAFLAGASIYRLRGSIPASRPLFVGSFAACGLLLAVPFGELFCPIPAAYMTVYLGIFKPKLWNFLKTGDYSYGIYLFGFVIQQAVAGLGPWAHHWWINLGISAPATMLVAVCSWHYVEKPALKLRTRLSAIEERWIRFTKNAGPLRLKVLVSDSLPNVKSPRTAI
jgi:peptidoglycan/LPS O-acetylase OafA/YrhL